MSDFDFEVPFEGDHRDVDQLPPVVEINESQITYQGTEEPPDWFENWQNYMRERAAGA